eukprot:INCI17633.1.p1 GENE.INCI17633.1~~INCI17633.1.p1  ORF type:complete len:602 (-),score=110.73 INCI17633.1:1419-3098(-)
MSDAPLQALTKKQKQKLKKQKLKQQKAQEAAAAKAKANKKASKAGPASASAEEKSQGKPKEVVVQTSSAWGSKVVRVKTFREIQEEEERERLANPAPRPNPVPESNVLASAWGSSIAAKSGPSLAQIQAEEAARQEQRQQHQPLRSSFASKIAARTLGMSAATVPTTSQSTKPTMAEIQAEQSSDQASRGRMVRAPSSSAAVGSTTSSPVPGTKGSVGAWGAGASPRQGKGQKSKQQQEGQAATAPAVKLEPVSLRHRADNQVASATLREMLGVSSGAQSDGTASKKTKKKKKAAAPVPAPTPAPVSSSWSAAPAVVNQPPPVDLRAIQAEEARRKQHEDATRRAAANAHARNTGSGAGRPGVWAAAAGSQKSPGSFTSGGRRNMSMAEIQAEQARQRARRGPAKVAGKWGSAAGASPATTSNSSTSGGTDLFWSMDAPSTSKSNDDDYPALGRSTRATASGTTSYYSSAVGKNSTAGRRSKSEFGGKEMPASMLAWCKQQLIALTGKDDVTLVHYVYSLKDPADIREYIRSFLGSTPKISAFATEFINRKAGRVPNRR